MSILCMPNKSVTREISSRDSDRHKFYACQVEAGQEFTSEKCAVIMALFALAYAGDYDDAQVIISQQPDYHYKPQPYTFGYEIKDEWGNTQHRREDSDEYNTKRGSYGFTDARGIYRKVEYVADGHGFRAVVKTNEPGTASQNPAHAHFHSSALHVPAHVLQQQHTVPVYVAVAQPIEESHHSKHNGGGYGHY
ncbi:uncharacterized protein LOC135366829 isoform X2 [Ornithodoros turicata]|uniref:uncharacterized protein LOC135366829 isoform X2 n=1 Tax=Ornithodoros turicata TaxID=34597 RepID=UPI003139D238